MTAMDGLLRCAAAGILICRETPEVAIHAGILWLRRDHEDDLAEATEVTTEARQAGATARRLLLPRLRGRERPHRAPDGVPLPPWAMRLSVLARQARTALGEGNWRLHWSDDGLPHLSQVDSAAPHVSEDTLVLLGGADTVPPGPFATTLLSRAGQDVLDELRQYLPVPTGRSLVVERDSRPYLNLSLVEETTRRLGLPTRTDTGPAWIPRPVPAVGITRAGRRTTRLLRALPALARAGLIPRDPLRLATHTTGQLAALSRPDSPDLRGAIDAVTRVSQNTLHTLTALHVAHTIGRATHWTAPARAHAHLTAALPAIFARLRVVCLTAAARTTRLPNPDTLWLLHPDEAIRVESGWTPQRQMLTHRTHRIPPTPQVWRTSEFGIRTPGTPR